MGLRWRSYISIVWLYPNSKPGAYKSRRRGFVDEQAKRNIGNDHRLCPAYLPGLDSRRVLRRAVDAPENGMV